VTTSPQPSLDNETIPSQDFGRKVGRSLLDSLASRSNPLQADSSGIREDVQSVLQQLKAVGYVEDFSVEWRKEGGESTADEPDLRIQLRVSLAQFIPDLDLNETGNLNDRGEVSGLCPLSIVQVLDYVRPGPDGFEKVLRQSPF
jgi:hypothetical protein